MKISKTNQIVFKKPKILIYIYVISIFVVLLFFGNETKYRIISLEINRQYSILLIVILIAFSSIIFNKKVTFDSVLILLFIRIFTLTIPLFYTIDFDGYLGNYFAVIVAFTIYLFFSNTSITFKFQRFISIFSFLTLLIILLQLVLTHLYYNSNLLIYNDIYKGFISIPLGDSNTLSSYILLFAIFSIFGLKTKFWKFLVYFLGFSAIYLTYSRGGLLTYFIFTILYPFLRNVTKRESIKLLSYALFSIFILYMVFITFIVLNRNNFFELDLFTSNRIYLYSIIIDKIGNNFIFGNGLGYPLNPAVAFEAERAHNLVLEILVQGGIVNLFITGGAIFLLMRNLLMNSFDSFSKGIAFSLCFVLIHGLIEPNIFSMFFDVVFWMYAAIGISYLNIKNRESNIRFLNHIKFN